MLDFIFQQSVLETIVIVGIVIAIIGIFWKIILIGGTALFCLTVLAKHLPPVEVKPSAEIVKPYQPNQEMIKEILLSLNLTNVVIAGDGQEGVFLAEKEKPCLIFMDLHMPVMDGVTAIST